MLFLLEPYSSNTPVHGLFIPLLLQLINLLLYISEHITGGRHIGVAVIFGGKQVCNTHYQYPTFNCLIYLFDDPKHITKNFIVSPDAMLKYLENW
jgi:hypothetical protein